MTKLWFKTKNDQIVDLNYATYFEIQVYAGKHSVLATNGKVSLCVGRFDTKEAAQAYLEGIYKLLTEKPKEWSADEFWSEYWKKCRSKKVDIPFDIPGNKYKMYN